MTKPNCMLYKLKGKRTYLICELGILWAVVGSVLGYMSVEESINITLAALGAAGLRAAK